MRLKLGEAFDVTAERKQTDFRSLPEEGRHFRAFESAYQIVLKNAKKEPITVVIREPVPGDWKMISASHPYTRVASDVAEWRVSVPADGKTALSYRVRLRNL